MWGCLCVCVGVCVWGCGCVCGGLCNKIMANRKEERNKLIHAFTDDIGLKGIQTDSVDL